MPVELALWRIDGGTPRRLPMQRIDREARLEDLIQQDVNILELDILLIGRQVPTSTGKFIDLLAIDAEGDLHVLELKRDRTARDVVSQALDYGSWVKDLTNVDVRRIWDDVHSEPFDTAFADHFGPAPPDTLNNSHQMTIVAAELDPSSERIVDYLTTEYGVPINVLFFQYLSDGDREYLGRSWLIPPAEVDAASSRRARSARRREPWNGQDFYVSFGTDGHRTWEDAQRYGFISAGGGLWYVRTMQQLKPGHRVFVHKPGTGYLGVGTVTAPVVPASQFEVTVNDATMPITQAATAGDLGWADGENEEHLVGVDWLRTREESDAVWTPGLFANQNTVCKLRNEFTLETLTEAFELDD